VFDGSTGYVSLPDYAWLNGGDYTIEGWAYKTATNIAPSPVTFGSGTGNMTAIVDWPTNGGFQVNLGYGTGIDQPQMSLAQGKWEYFAVV
jgi:hypothetical protein